MDNVLLDVIEIAAALRTKKGHIYRLVRNRQIPHFKIGKKLKFDLQKVLEAMKRGIDN